MRLLASWGTRPRVRRRDGRGGGSDARRLARGVTETVPAAARAVGRRNRARRASLPRSRSALKGSRTPLGALSRWKGGESQCFCSCRVRVSHERRRERATLAGVTSRLWALVVPVAGEAGREAGGRGREAAARRGRSAAPRDARPTQDHLKESFGRQGQAADQPSRPN